MPAIRWMAAVAIALILAPATAAPAEVDAPVQKNCVGNPPRQTEDPLSPACVPFWDGEAISDYPGVEDDHLRLVLYNDAGYAGDLNEPWRPSDGTYATSVALRTIKAHLHHFGRRMQTYGRAVRLTAVEASDPSCRGRATDADWIIAEHDPLAVIVMADAADCFVRTLAAAGRFAFAMRPLTEAAMEASAPFVYTFLPPAELQARAMAASTCRSLAGEQASFASDPGLRTQTRVFGLVLPRAGDDPALRRWGATVRAGSARLCGASFVAARVGMSGDAADARGILLALARFMRSGVTTVLCACPHVGDHATLATLQRAATIARYGPEWVLDSMSGMDVATWHAEHGTPGQVTFGPSSLWRQPSMQQQFHYQAYLAEQPGSAPDTAVSFESYHAFLTAFAAIQLAGPSPNATTIPEGMETWSSAADPPFTPTGGMGAHDPAATGPASFVDSWMAWWFDPSGTPPGGGPGSGCVRVANDGLRWRLSDGPAGDAHLFTPEAPCTGAPLTPRRDPRLPA